MGPLPVKLPNLSYEIPFKIDSSVTEFYRGEIVDISIEPNGNLTGCAIYDLRREYDRRCSKSKFVQMLLELCLIKEKVSNFKWQYRNRHIGAVLNGTEISKEYRRHLLQVAEENGHTLEPKLVDLIFGNLERKLQSI